MRQKMGEAAGQDLQRPKTAAKAMEHRQRHHHHHLIVDILILHHHHPS
jgi:hypothetical protein